MDKAILKDINDVCARSNAQFGYQLFWGSCGMFAMALAKYVQDRYDLDSEVIVYSMDDCEDFFEELGSYGHAILRINVPVYNAKGHIVGMDVAHFDGNGYLDIEDRVEYADLYGPYEYEYLPTDEDFISYTYAITAWFDTMDHYLDFIWNVSEAA